MKQNAEWVVRLTGACSDWLYTKLESWNRVLVNTSLARPLPQSR